MISSIIENRGSPGGTWLRFRSKKIFDKSKKGEIARYESIAVKPGVDYPLGATFDGEGVNFAIFSEHATGVELCLFRSRDDSHESHRIKLTDRTGFVWHCYLPGLMPGALYGYRIYGPFDPEAGHRFNPSKILLDPYARIVSRQPQICHAIHGEKLSELDEVEAITDDSAPFAALAEVSGNESFNWGGVEKPGLHPRDMVIMETHVRGFTILNPEVPSDLRGTYAGFSSRPVIEYLKNLGVTCVEFLPVQNRMDEPYIVEQKRTNYWGYNTLSFFMPEPRYAKDKSPRGVIREFKEMVKTLHQNGIEVILDVVYNHTAEGGEGGPCLSFRGIDNAVYYRLDSENKSAFLNWSGCGNSFNSSHPVVMQLILDSLRFWVTEFQIDGFRFDLAVSLGREEVDFAQNGVFLSAVYQDPVLKNVKLIAEPWDLGPEGYRPGNFPVNWKEWNGKYRDCMRKVWKGDRAQMSEFATRFSGSSDLYRISGRSPGDSINFITAHDGFSLYDLVSYNKKHNEGNGEDNRDGDNHNLSWNSGVEGHSEDPELVSLRFRRMRNMMATLLLSQGIPMFPAGDERGRTQNGNNNAYCHDNEVSWISWETTPHTKNFQEFVRNLITVRKENRIFARNKFYSEEENSEREIIWLHPEGREITSSEWLAGGPPGLGIYIPRSGFKEKGARGEELEYFSALLFINPSMKDIKFQIPDFLMEKWQRIFDTRLQFFDEKPVIVEHMKFYHMINQSMALFRVAR